MTYAKRLTRRGALACQAAFLTTIALPGKVSARIGVPEPSCANPTHPLPCAPARWDTATADELAGFVGQRFRVRTRTQGDIVLKLVALEPHASGGARPAHLPRREGVTALFDSPDIAPLLDEGAGTYAVSHPLIGSADLHLGTSPRRDGGTEIVLVLN